MGLKDVEHTEHGLVYATVPATIKNGESLPVVAFNAHVDTSPETTGKNVKPHVIRHYGGGDLGNRGEIVARPGHPSHPATLALVLPPLAALVLVPT